MKDSGFIWYTRWEKNDFFVNNFYYKFNRKDRKIQLYHSVKMYINKNVKYAHNQPNSLRVFTVE